MSENAKITSTFLGREDHGILTLYLTVGGDGWGISIGGYALDEYSKELGCRVPTAVGFKSIDEILKVVGVDSWEKLKGQHIRVENMGLGQRITNIGNLIEDKWFDFRDFFEANDAIY